MSLKANVAASSCRHSIAAVPRLVAPVAWARTPVVASFFLFHQIGQNKKTKKQQTQSGRGVSPEGIEPPTFGFGIRRATNYAIGSWENGMEGLACGISHMQQRMEQKKNARRVQPESNWRPQDLQSHALPLSYAPAVTATDLLACTVAGRRQERNKKLREVLPGLEPGSKDSKSLVMTITL